VRGDGGELVIGSVFGPVGERVATGETIDGVNTGSEGGRRGS
jgi:hypothetical protein